MVALDTNLLVRIVVEDDPWQTREALAAIQGQASVFVSKTVLLELEWVLRGSYRAGRDRILAALQGLVDAANFEIEDEPAVRRAIELFGRGLDFADALHLASAGERQFVTFDKDLQKRARRLGLGNVEVP